jgi:hypothetical protein
MFVSLCDHAGVPEIVRCDLDGPGFGWIEVGGIRRCAHALAREGQVWLVDPFDWDGLDERVREAGEPAGVIQLLDRHARDCAAIAARLGVPHHAPPFRSPPGVPFELVPLVRRRWWQEAALWWPEERVLVCADALGSVGYFRTAHEPLGVHPILRLVPPRRLRGYAPQHILFGHGEGVHGDTAAPALAEALRTSRRRLPAALANAFRR